MKEKLKFTERNQKGLHCRFCMAEFDGATMNLRLYETSPIKGIVCNGCKPHLENYLKGD